MTINLFKYLFNKTELFVKTIEDDYCDLQNSVKSFNGKCIKPINYSDLVGFPFWEKIPINKYVLVERRPDRFKGEDTLLSFDTYMKKGGEFGEHFHADLIESCEVLQGELIDLIDGKKYIKGDVMHYEKGERHTPIASKDSVLHVMFKR